MLNSKIKIAEKTILVIDSQELVRTIIVDILRTIGAKKIHTARNGKEGIKQIRTWLPDLVFCDSHPGGITGIELVKWVRCAQGSPNPQMPIVYVSSDRTQQQIINARDAGVNEIIIKPIVPQAVISRLKAALAINRTFVRSMSFVGPDRRRNRTRTYKGGKRRLSDDAESAVAVNEAQQSMIVEALDAILADLPDIKPSDRISIMALYKKSEQLWQLVHTTEDRDLDSVAQCLLKYIQAVGASGRLQTDLVKMHLEAARQLVAPEGQQDRRVIMEQLNQTIDKVLHPAASSHS